MLQCLDALPPEPPTGRKSQTPSHGKVFRGQLIMIIFLLDYPNLHTKCSRAYSSAKVKDAILSVESKNTKMLFPKYN